MIIYSRIIMHHCERVYYHNNICIIMCFWIERGTMLDRHVIILDAAKHICHLILCITITRGSELCSQLVISCTVRSLM